MLKNYGRSSKLLLAEKDIPDLHFDEAQAKEKSKPSERTDVMEIMSVDTKENAQNSDFREHSRNTTGLQVCYETSRNCDRQKYMNC